MSSAVKRQSCKRRIVRKIVRARKRPAVFVVREFASVKTKRLYASIDKERLNAADTGCRRLNKPFYNQDNKTFMRYFMTDDTMSGNVRKDKRFFVASGFDNTKARGFKRRRETEITRCPK